MFLGIFKRSFLPLFILMSGSTFFDQFLTRNYEDAMGGDSSSSLGFALIVFFSFLNGVVAPLLSWVVFLYATRKLAQPATSFVSFFGKNIKPLTIESLRSLGKTFLWSLLLIIPGMIRMVQLSLVPFVVTLHEGYPRGQVDALQASTRLVNRYFVRISGILILIYLIWPGVSTAFFSEQRDFFSSPITALLHSALDTTIEVGALFLLYRLFLRVSKSEVAGKVS